MNMPSEHQDAARRRTRSPSDDAGRPPGWATQPSHETGTRCALPDSPTVPFSLAAARRGLQRHHVAERQANELDADSPEVGGERLHDLRVHAADGLLLRRQRPGHVLVVDDSVVNGDAATPPAR